MRNLRIRRSAGVGRCAGNSWGMEKAMKATVRVRIAALHGLLLVLVTVGPVLARQMQDTVTGLWDWEIAPKWCAENPHSITFSRDGSKMEVRHPKGASIAGGVAQALVVYEVLSKSPGLLKTRVVGETQTSGRGDIVSWDLVLLSPDAYCWRRSDWPPGSCTRRIIRCPSSAK